MARIPSAVGPADAVIAAGLSIRKVDHVPAAAKIWPAPGLLTIDPLPLQVISDAP